MATANQGFSPPRLRNYRRRGEVPAILLLAGLFGAALLLIAYSVYTSNLRQDVQRREGEEKILAGSLVNQQRTLARTLIDYTNWNESFDRLAGAFDPIWAQSNIGATVQEILKYQLSLTVKPDGSAAYGRLDGTVDAQRAMQALGPEAGRLITQAQGGAGPPQPAVAIVSGPEGLFLAGASAILPEEGGRIAPPPRARSILVFGRRLNAAWLTRIEEDFGLRGLAFVDPTVTPAAGLATVDLRGPAGEVVGRVAWQPRRSGQKQLEWLLPALAGNLLAIAIFAGVAVRGLRLARALSGSRAHLRDFVEVSSDYLWETDAAMRVTWLSASFAKRTGLQPEVLLGNRRQDLRTEDVGDDDWASHLADLAAHRPFRDFTYSLRDGEGRQRLLQISGKPVFGPNRRFLGYRGTGRDITAEGEANRRLRESENRFRSLVENLRGIIFCRGVAGNGPYGYDEHGVQVFGPDAQHLTPISATAAWYAIVHPDDLPGYLEAERRRKEQSNPYSLEYRVDPTGSGEERWMQEVAWVTEAPAEQKRYLDSYVIDITDRKRTEIQLAEQGRENATYRAMIAALPDVIFAKDLEGRFIAANTPTATLVGAGSAAALIGRSDFDFFPPEVARGYRDSELAFHASGQTVLIEQTVHHAGRVPILLKSLKTPLIDEAGRTIGYVGHNRDITDERHREAALQEAHERLAQQADELRRLAHAAEQASRAKSEFLAAMSHEIRTPMTGVLGMADLLAVESLSPPQRRYLETIRNSGRHLLGIINSILDFSRIEAGRMEIERIDFAPAQVLEQAQSILAPQAAERGLELRIEQAVAAVLVVRGDPTRLQQVLVNLVGNGLKFTAQGSVTLTARELPSAAGTVRLRFEVRDTGIGIPHDRQADLFEAFVQATQSTNRHYGGSGLGLAICRRLVEAMGGTIGLESEPGQGSLFWFELAFEPGDALAAAQRNVAAPPRIRPLRVLIADDVAANRELVAAMLGRHGHVVLVAENGADAVEQVASELPDVVLMDIQMPVMDGLEATRRIRLLPQPQASVPILALTANVMASERRRYLAAGMDHCLTKPIDWSELFSALAGIATGDQPPAGTAPATPPDAAAVSATPLLDRAMLDGMARNLPSGAFRQLLARGLDSAGQSHRQLVEAIGEPTALAQAAHRLRGTAGSFGLALIAALAGAIEERVSEGQDVTALVDELKQAVESTRVAAGQLTVEA